MTRRNFLTKAGSVTLAAGVGGTLLEACGSSTTSTTKTPKLTVQVLDGGGTLQLVKQILLNYQKTYPDKVNFQFLPSATAPTVPGKIKAQEDAHKQDIALVLGGYDLVASGIAAGIWEQVLPAFSSKLPDFTSIYQDPVKQYATLTNGYAIPLVYTAGSPLFEYDPAKVATPPTTIDQLKAWILANPHKFEYARPRNSGPGRTFLMGLPYLLGDSDPIDPTNGWAKTWAFLKAIDPAIFILDQQFKDVPVSLAPSTSQHVVTMYGRPEYDTVSQNYTVVMPLSAANLSKAFDTWDAQIGGSKLKSS